MVQLTKIYTRTGDGGETGIGDGSRVSKLDDRIVAGGSVDETNCLLGVAASQIDDDVLLKLLRTLQQRLFDLGADITCPFDPDAEADRCPRMSPEHVTWLEERIDEANERLQPLKSFILPGGLPGSASLHLARSVCRRAELDVLRLQKSTQLNPQIAVFLNRLSDLLFVLARRANNDGQQDVLWLPGSE